MFYGSRPMELVLLNSWVAETKLKACLSKSSIMRAKFRSYRLRRFTM